MTLVVRNTFFHVSKVPEEGNALGCARRTRSTPPPIKEEAGFFKKCDGSSPSSGWVTDRSTAASEHENEIEAEAVVGSGYETDDGSDELFVPNRDCVTGAMSPSYGAVALPAVGAVAPPAVCAVAPPAVDVAQRVEKMSQQVVDVWQSLSALEAKTSQPLPAEPQPTQPPPMAWAPVQVPPPPTPIAQVGPAPWTRTSLDSKARPFKIATASSEVDTVLASTKQILVSSPCIDTVAITLGTGGTVATLTVQLAQGWQSSVGRRNVAALAKSALMDTTYSSQNVYILGYESQPFEELPESSGFALALAVVPAAWYSTACWETYQKGCCPRSNKCKWKHPGRDEIRPVRVVIS